MKPRIFIGSSSENISVANAIQANLMEKCEPEIWNQSINILSKSTISNLIDAINTYDFAIFVFGAEDNAIIRDANVQITRDNIIFETGLFIGKIGINRVFFVKPKSIDIHMPSDLLGITYGQYDDTHSNLTAALCPFCIQVINQIDRTYMPEIPETGPYGINILTSQLTELRSTPICERTNTYGLYAKTSNTQKLIVTIHRLKHESSHDPWYFELGTVQGWSRSRYENGYQSFILDPESKGKLEIFFVDSGSAEITVTMNDIDVPILRKVISWS